MKIKVLGGAGAVGSAVAKDLLRNSDVSQVVIADIDEKNGKAVAKELDDERVSFEMFDADSGESIKKVMDALWSAVACCRFGSGGLPPGKADLTRSVGNCARPNPHPGKPGLRKAAASHRTPNGVSLQELISRS